MLASATRFQISTECDNMLIFKSLGERLFNRRVSDIVGPVSEDEKESRPLPTLLGLLIPIVAIALVYILILLNGILPYCVLIKDETNDPSRFVGERAKQYLEGLVAVGPRVTGGEKIDEAANYFIDIIQNISNHASPENEIEIDIQRPTGIFFFSRKPYGIMSMYENIKNIVVRFSNRGVTNNSILVNCHYDTVPQSPGAADNGMNCAIMLELLNKLSKSNNYFQHSIIFLFNGAEENGLQGVRGFMKSHKWAEECKVVINIDAAGSGGKELLFQVSKGYSWFVKLYADVAPHPSGSVLFEDIYRTGFLPSTTDFSSFEELSLPGYDFAQVDNGFVYHTRLDKVEYIAEGAYQHTGDNILALIKALATSSSVDKVECGSEDMFVYFDYLGWFMVVYTESSAKYINSTIFIVSILTIVYTLRILPDVSKHPFKYFSLALLAQLLTQVLVLAVMALFVCLLDLFHSTLSWYSKPFYISALYGLIIFYIGCFLPYIFHNFYKPETCRYELATIHCCAVQFILSLLLLAGSIVEFRSTYVMLMLVGFPALINTILIVLRLFTAKIAVLSFLLSPLPSILYTGHFLVKILIVLIPISARTGVTFNPEYIIAGVTLVLGILSTCYMTPIFLVFKRPYIISGILFLINLAAFLAVIVSPFGFPYSSDPSSPALQRLRLVHTRRTFYNSENSVRESNGFSLTCFDHNNIYYISKSIPEWHSAQPAHSSDSQEVFWGVPVFYTRYQQYAYWLEGSQPYFTKITNLEIISSSKYNEFVETRKRVTLRASGPDHLTVLIHPKPGVILTGWSFDKNTPNPGVSYNDRPTYIVFFTSQNADKSGMIEFHLDFESTNTTAPLSDIALVGHEMHHSTLSTDFKNVLDKFPNWTSVQYWTAHYISRVLT